MSIPALPIAFQRVQVLLLSLLDLPFSISPVVTGLMLMLLYGRAGWFAQALAENGWNIVFAFPGARGGGGRGALTTSRTGLALRIRPKRNCLWT